jgi:phosphate starvation-inducible membrane PsiE
MMAISYFQGQKHYPIPYKIKKCLGYISISCIIYLIHHLLRNATTSLLIVHLSGIILTMVFLIIAFRIEKEEFKKIPIFQKFFKLG